jgi:hypothetical protein
VKSSTAWTLFTPARGINLYGRQWVHGHDRKQLERLARYITRPPIAQERLTQRPDGTLLLEFTGRLRRLGAAGASPTVYLRGKLHCVDLVHSGSRKLGRMGAAPWYSRLKTSWCVFALRCRRPAFTQSGILAFSPAIPRSARVSYLSRPKIPPRTVRHQLRVTNSSC